MFYSQAGQDVWVLQQIPKGFFVDVGAHDGVESSNTYALEKVGWEGICIEPNPVSYDKLSRNRASINMKMTAVAQDAGGGTSLKTILALADSPAVIDYLSIDVDGGELGVLHGMDFKKYHVRLITIEHNAYAEGTKRQEQIFQYLEAQGFIRVVKDVKCLDGEWFGLIYEDWYARNVGLPIITKNL